ncbi:MAG: outer membrane protein assembly factor BamA [Prevotellaceae bacterium]|jgi:outer membrane protein insertion porin family|nr:outer membrane protein assembly factor BamA [Prevotellaceae bacterium]
MKYYNYTLLIAFRLILASGILIIAANTVVAQTISDSTKVELNLNAYNPQQYVIADITIEGVKYINPETILSFMGFVKGDTITLPGEDISFALKKLWAQRYFSDIAIYASKIVDNQIYLIIQLTERPRVSVWDFKGVKKGEAKDLREKLRLRRGGELSDYVLKTSTDLIKEFFDEKGFRKAEVNIIQENDTLVPNAVKVIFDVQKNDKVTIKKIDVFGNKNISKGKIRKQMKNKDASIWNFFSSKKFKDQEYPNDLEKIINYYNQKGYRDAVITADSVFYLNNKKLGINITVDEGQRYYFRNITWVGNSIVPSTTLYNILSIKKGDVYDVVAMNKMLYADQSSVSTQYNDQGYLFFKVEPVEVNIVGDSVDIEMRIYEGKQAVFKRVNITGNHKTNEHIIRRELWTRPGNLYSKSALERSIRELAQSQNYDAEKLTAYGEGFFIDANERDGTVDITYNVEEKSNDQVELSGGYGGNTFIATVGFRFSNFSIKNIFNGKAWRPVPSGDGQTLAIRFQTNGTYYTAFSLSFMEPWLGGRKPTSLSVSTYYTRETNASYFYQSATQSLETYGISAGIGQRLKWPDSYFTLYTGISLQHYILNDWQYNFLFSNGTSNNLSFNVILGRNSTDQPIYPRGGSDLSLGVQFTPPYSLFSPNKDYKNMSDDKRYRWIEYHKWTFKAAVYTRLMGDLVLMTRVQFGFLGYYNQDWGYSPFESFVLGGDGMGFYNRYGQENIALRGYTNASITPRLNNAYAGRIYDKFTLELRHPIIMQPQANIYGYVFFEGGNAWASFDRFNPFAIKRSAGLGVKLMLPVVGILGIDWGYGFDNIPGNPSAGGGQIHFTFGMPM